MTSEGKSTEMIKKRIGRVAVTAALLLTAGSLYYLELKYIGYGIRCPFERLTGYRCPGCGVTSMALCLIRGDLEGAWNSNQLTFMLLPFYAYLMLRLASGYIRTGRTELPGRMTAVIWVIIVSYLAFGIWRNLV